MSAASVRTSGRRDNLPVFPKAAGNKGEPGSFSKPVALRYWSRSELFELVMDGQLFLFAALFLEALRQSAAGLDQHFAPGRIRVQTIPAFHRERFVPELLIAGRAPHVGRDVVAFGQDLLRAVTTAYDIGAGIASGLGLGEGSSRRHSRSCDPVANRPGERRPNSARSVSRFLRCTP